MANNNHIGAISKRWTFMKVVHMIVEWNIFPA